MGDDPVEAVLPLVYDELHALARRMHGERGLSLHATSVVHEAFLRLSKNDRLQWRSRAHFLAIAAKAMRHVLSDRARRRGALRRGGGWEQVTLEGVGAASRVVDLVELSTALDELAQLDPRGAATLEMRLLAGMTIAEIAQVTGRSARTVERDWRAARAWMVDRLEG
jgi:RNA polymerase sigma-70 factor, ECF subfamily